MTPLHVAVFYGSANVTKILLEMGVAINALDFGSCEPLAPVQDTWYSQFIKHTVDTQEKGQNSKPACIFWKS